VASRDNPAVQAITGMCAFPEFSAARGRLQFRSCPGTKVDRNTMLRPFNHR
jgi:hypothetical protein